MWFHIFLSAKSQMEQVRHPLTTPWINAMPFLTIKVGGIQGFVDATQAVSKTEIFNKELPARETKVASDILIPNVKRDKGLIEN